LHPQQVFMLVSYQLVMGLSSVLESKYLRHEEMLYLPIDQTSRRLLQERKVW
jgi:hypothetical protein